MTYLIRVSSIELLVKKLLGSLINTDLKAEDDHCNWLYQYYQEYIIVLLVLLHARHWFQAFQVSFLFTDHEANHKLPMLGKFYPVYIHLSSC